VLNLGKLVGILLYVFDLPHKRLVRRNLRFCNPDWSGARIRKLSRLIFANAGTTLVELCQSPFLSREDLLGMFQLRGEEHFHSALKSNRGIIIISAHMGSWEVAPQFFTSYFQISMLGVARRLRLRRLDRWMHHIRTRFGMNVIYKKNALPKMMRALRRGEILALFVDQSKYKQGVDVTFLGRKATVTPAVALLAIRCKSPILPIFSLRKPDGTLTLQVNPPIELKRSTDLPADLQRGAQIMMNAIEDMVLKYPDQWAWYQRMWKTSYPYLYPEWEARRQRRQRKKKRRLKERAL
jgi:KDO2-lipid IV(A) lauroyltransferase